MEICTEFQHFFIHPGCMRVSGRKTLLKHLPFDRKALKDRSCDCDAVEKPRWLLLGSTLFHNSLEISLRSGARL